MKGASDPPGRTAGFLDWVLTAIETALRFDGGYNVSMCYRTPEGAVGQAKSGVWASGQSGIRWFFDRDNAEVLVRVLDGCGHNPTPEVFQTLHGGDSTAAAMASRGLLGTRPVSNASVLLVAVALLASDTDASASRVPAYSRRVDHTRFPVGFPEGPRS